MVHSADHRLAGTCQAAASIYSGSSSASIGLVAFGEWGLYKYYHLPVWRVRNCDSPYNLNVLIKIQFDLAFHEVAFPFPTFALLSYSDKYSVGGKI